MIQLQHTNHLSLPTSYQKCKNDPKDKSAGRWTKEEHQRFVEALKKYGKNWKLVEDYVGTRSGAQIRSHAQKFFNRLERDFNLKFDDLNVQSTKDKFEETLLKMSDYSEISVKEQKPRKCSDKTVCSSPEGLNESSSKFLSISNSPKLDQFESQNLKTLNTKKISDELKSYSLFDIIMSKVKTSNNAIVSPKLSDLLDLSSSSTRSSFDSVSMSLEPELTKQIVQVQTLFNSSFKLHPRKMSEDNIMKLNLLRRPEESIFNDVEILCKKYKTN